MASILENFNIAPCIWFEGGDKRNAFISMLSGFLFFTAWWIVIDAASVYTGSISAGYHMCGVMGTLSLLMVNSVSNAQLRDEMYEGGCLGMRGARIWLFIGFVLGFATIIASTWILFADFVGPTNVVHQWPGIAIFMQNMLILVSSLIFKFGRSEEMWG